VIDFVSTVARLADIFRAYEVREVLGDQFAAIPLAAEFKRHGITLTEETATSRSKLEHFTRLREAFYARRVSLPRHEVTLREFRDLQETITAGGTVRIDHPVGGTSDCASAVTWCAAAIELSKGRTAWPEWALSSLNDDPLSGEEDYERELERAWGRDIARRFF
jgi:hypothetical protein